MLNKKYLIPIFIIVALVQLYIPARMVWQQEELWTSGREYKFKMVPIDPNDPFRGKYITLSYEATNIQLPTTAAWKRGQSVYVMLMEDAEGYAKIESVSRQAPSGNSNYVKASVQHFSAIDNMLHIRYPFRRFYMEESKALPAERLYRKYMRDTTQVGYGLVNIKKGDAVLRDVRINEVSIVDLVEEEMKMEK